MALALHIVRFPEALEDSLAELLPNRITDYLYELSDRFNSFYVECKVYLHWYPVFARMISRANG